MQFEHVSSLSPMEKAELIRAGLGPRKLNLFWYGDSGEFHDSIISVQS